MAEHADCVCAFGARQSRIQTQALVNAETFQQLEAQSRLLLALSSEGLSEDSLLHLGINHSIMVLPQI